MRACSNVIQILAFGLVLTLLLAPSFAFLPTLVSPFQRHHLAVHLERRQDTTTTTRSNDAPFSLQQHDFVRRCQVDTTLRHTREQLPVLLKKPLTRNDVEQVYAQDVVLVGPRDEELACGREELMTLSATLVAATAAARQANAFASSLQQAGLNTTTSTLYTVVSELCLDVQLQAFRVQWKVDLPALGTKDLVGLSEFILNEEGRVSVHRLLDVSIDGQTLNSVGETLATLRRAVKSVGDSPLLSTLRDSPLASSLDGMLRDSLLSLQNDDSPPLPPLYVTDTISRAFNDTCNMTLMDDAAVLSPDSPPLPGSIQWPAYAASFRSVSSFIEYGIPILSTGSEKDDYTKLFAPDAQLKGLDGSSIMATGGERIAEFYRTMASLRKGTKGNWEICNVSADWDNRSVLVSWMANSTPIQVKGRDRFQLCDSDEPVIQTIEQLELVIGGNRVQDPEWFRTFLNTIESGRSTVGGDMLVELLQKAGPSTKKASTGPPKLNPEAAASVYGILCALHRDLPTLADANARSPPAKEYLSSNVELRGYLDELLAKGPASYRQVSNVLTTSLQGALRTGRVTCDSPPEPTIEFTAKGLIRVSLVIKLRVKVTPGDSDVGAVPLVFELVSEYKVNSQGKIKEHKLIESRVNGQLTPGDVVSRWFKGETTDYSNPVSIQSFLDALSWARGFSSTTRQ